MDNDDNREGPALSHSGSQADPDQPTPLRQTVNYGKQEGGSDMYSEEYKRAKKEFINCMIFGIVGMGVPFYIGFKEWLPIMKREKEKALSAAQKTSK